uniref:Helitron helicase-like domain-containing protein n=1 Tax=Panagrolaimus davidi TaxID=227884 RepID=A0A914QVQ7_9BILA
MEKPIVFSMAVLPIDQIWAKSIFFVCRLPFDFFERQPECVLNKEALETVAEFCSRKRIRNDTKGKAQHKQSVKVAKEKLANNEKAKEYMINKIKTIKTEDGCTDTVTDNMEVDENFSQDLKLMTNAEEIKAQNDAKETFAAFCKRLKISTKTSRNKYNAAIKSVKDKLVENERLKEYKRKKRLTESAKEKKERLQKVAESMQTLRDNETEEQRSQRLQKKSEAMQKVRDNETEEEKQERLKKDAEAKQIKRENETEEEKQQRLNDDKNEKAIKRTINRIEKQEKLKKERAERIKNANTKSSFIPQKAANFKNVKPFRLGKRDVICNGCGAKHFRTEKRQKDGTFTNCCQQGKVKMQVGVFDYPKLFKDLMTKKHENRDYSRVFDLEKRTINSSLSCAHMYAKNVKMAPGVPCLKIQGKVMHKMPKTYLPKGDNATFGGQNYVVDSGTATSSRIDACTKMNKRFSIDLMKDLDQTMRQVNVFAKSYTMLKDTVQKEKANQEAKGEKPRELRLVFKGTPNAARNYDKVEAENEIALVFTPGPDGEVPRDDIVIYDNENGKGVTEYLRSWDPRVEPLTYPLFYPIGKETTYEQQKRDPKNPKSGKLTEREYFNFKFQDRDEEKYGFNPFLYGGKLFLQYLCDAWARVENGRLQWYKSNQKQIRAASYLEVHEALNKKAQEFGKAPGTVKILPSTFYGGPRYLRELCSDAITMVDEYGKPTTMITMTVNPEDEDIINNLYEDQKAWERPD